MSKIDNTLIEKIKSDFGESILDIYHDDFDRLHVLIPKDKVFEFGKYAHGDLDFKHANFCMGIDLDDKIEVSWYIGNIEYSTIMVIKSHLDRENPEVHSLRSLWDSFNWHERETYEMVGIDFVNHGDLRRLILPDLWEGFPLRNDYVYKKPQYRKPEDELMP
ncbi:MAG: NADH-quinone oxidoreductase subunit C [Candidatus Heimdallarchaeota archaeon]|nr:NADH-quinone oxidoreductase subunit C [Candidatus Heimdallarchaeota archaeon]